MGLQQRTRQTHALPLAAGEQPAAFAQMRLQTLRQFLQYAAQIRRVDDAAHAREAVALILGGIA